MSLPEVDQFTAGFHSSCHLFKVQIGVGKPSHPWMKSGLFKVKCWLIRCSIPFEKPLQRRFSLLQTPSKDLGLPYSPGKKSYTNLHPNMGVDSVAAPIGGQAGACPPTILRDEGSPKVFRNRTFLLDASVCICLCLPDDLIDSSREVAHLALNFCGLH